MADVIYKKGQSANLDDVAIVDGQILVTEDTAEMYIDMSDGTRKKISAVGQKTEQGGEIFNDYENNEATEVFSHAEGSGTIAAGEYSHAEGFATITLAPDAHAEGCATIAGTYAFNILAWDESNKTYTLDSVEGLEVNDIFSIKWNTSHINYGKITAIDGNTITVDNIIINAEDFETKKLFIVEKPEIGTEPLDEGAHAEGWNTQAVLYGAHAEGGETKALGSFAHAEGRDTQAGYSAHSEGRGTRALGEISHAEGGYTESLGQYSHAEGYKTQALSIGSGRGASHAEGGETIADGQRSHAEGSKTHTLGYAAHAEGEQSTAEGQATHAEGFNTLAKQGAAHAEGWATEALGMYSHSEGYRTSTSEIAIAAHAEGGETKATAQYAHAEGNKAKATGNYSHAEGTSTTAEGDNSHAEGNQTKASGQSSHSEGELSNSTSLASHAEGYQSQAGGAASHAEGTRTRALNERAHAEGGETLASGRMSHAEGDHTVAKGESSHAEGIGVTSSKINPLGVGYLPDENYGALGKASHAEGGYTTATGEYSHAGGLRTKATATAQTAIGRYNKEDANALLIVGNGASDTRKNAFTVNLDGTATIQTAPKKDMDVANKGYVDQISSNIQYTIYNSLADISGLPAGTVTTDQVFEKMSNYSILIFSNNTNNPNEPDYISDVPTPAMLVELTKTTTRGTGRATQINNPNANFYDYSWYGGNPKVSSGWRPHFPSQKTLWSGTSQMTGTQEITLKEPISKQHSGIVLVFSEQENNVALNQHFEIKFVPKIFVTLNGNDANKGGLDITMHSSKFGNIGAKYLYIYDGKIKGHNDNNQSGYVKGPNNSATVNTQQNFVKFDNAHWVLRYVIGV